MHFSKFIPILVGLFFVFSNNNVFANDASIKVLKNEMGDIKAAIQSLQAVIENLNLTVESQNEVIQRQNIRIDSLEDGKIASSTVASGDIPQLEGKSQGYNPEIGVVGTVVANLTESTEDGEGNDTIALKELEVSYSQYVDPYSRLDAIIAFNDNLEGQNVDIEEAYYTRWGLPFDFVAQIGKFRSKIGKANLNHLHQLNTVNYPLVIQDFFGEEGLSSSGIRIKNIIPNPWDIPLEISAEILRGNNGDSFSGISRRPIFTSHASTFFDINDDVTLEIGTTALFGDENVRGDAKGDDHYGVHVFGADATLFWYLPEGRRLKWQNELYFQDRSSAVTPNHDPWGFYSLIDYKVSPRFSAGIRFDYLEPRGVSEGHQRTTSISPYLTFYQSEFANFRLQYSHTDPADSREKADDAIFLQANFLIGSHKHPVQ